MARSASAVPTEAEAEILVSLWKQGGAGTVADMVKAVGRRRAQAKRPVQHYNTILTILRIMERKGLVRHGRAAGQRGFVYKTSSVKERTRLQVLRYVRRLYYDNRKEFLSEARVA